MKVTTIAEALQMEPGQDVLAIHGIIDSKGFFKPKTGTNEHGDWKLQNIQIKDTAGNRIKVKLCDQETLEESVMGREIIMNCTQNQKGSWCGVKIKEDTFNGKTSKILNVTKTAEVVVQALGTGAPAPQSEAPPAATPQPTRPAATAPSPNARPAIMNSEQLKAEAVRQARAELGRAANAYWLCILAAEYNFKRYQDHFGDPMSEGQFQAMVSTLFIHLDRAGKTEGIPTGDMTPFMKVAKPAVVD